VGAGKVIISLILIIIGIWAVLPESWYGLGLWQELWLVVKGVVPAFLVFIGLIMFWIEAEEMKVQKPRRRKR
jgi:hypothetical protein